MSKRSIWRLKRDAMGIAPNHKSTVLWDVVHLKDGRYGRIKDGKLYNVSLTKRLGRLRPEPAPNT
jgi:hypothetical protein